MKRNGFFARFGAAARLRTLNKCAERQLANNDCGLAVSKSALNFCGVSVARHELREALSFDEEGSSFEDIKRTLEGHGVECVYRIIETSSLSLDALEAVLPCIVMVESKRRNHYLLLHSLSPTGVYVLDPQKGYFEDRKLDFLRDTLSRITSTVNEEATLAFVSSYNLRRCEELGIAYDPRKPRAGLIMDYNKIVYFESLVERLGLEDRRQKAEYLSELLASADDSVIPSRFKTFRVDTEQFIAKAPLALSFRSGQKPVLSEESSGAEPIQRLLLRMLDADEQRANLKRMFVLGVAGSLISLLIVYANQILVDEVIPSRELSTLYAFVTMLLLFRLFELSQNLMKSYVEVSLGKTMDQWLCQNLHEKLIYSSFESISSYSRGELSLRLNDLLRIKTIVSVFINDYIFSFVTFVLAFCMASYISVKVSLVIVLVSASYAYILGKTVAYVKSMESRRFSEKSQVVNSLINIVEGHAVIAKNHGESVFLDDQRIKVEKFLDVQFKGMLASQLLVYIPRFIAIIGSLFVVLISAKSHILDGELSLGEIFTLIALSEMCFVALRTILRTKLNLQEQAVVVERYFDLINIEQRKRPDVDHDRVQAMNIRGLEYQYPASNFRIKVPELSLRAGDRVLLTGSNGSGKSTFLKIISGILQKNVGGSIEFLGENGLPISRDQGLLRVALIRAEDKIFSETIGFNITLSNERGGKRIYEFARKVGADDFISPVVYPLDTVIHDQGGNLSTGQKRKLLILRVLFSKADVIIFDEIFRGIDADSKRKIVQTLNEISDRKIVIYTTHEELDQLSITKKIEISGGCAVEYA
ncbi:ATP-binding cassette domain-containing protein [Pseudomonas sp. CGJS7]|uniref:ATP-binding cassette domain-containing protein n=1 Tax=Pseudomonas sp. CGJS7 TaxID=3109348 RepID=UPI00300B1ADE